MRRVEGCLDAGGSVLSMIYKEPSAYSKVVPSEVVTVSHNSSAAGAVGNGLVIWDPALRYMGRVIPAWHCLVQRLEPCAKEGTVGKDLGVPSLKW